MVLDEPLDVVKLRRSCGQYSFPRPDGLLADPIFHPQRLICQISELAGESPMPMYHDSLCFGLPCIFKQLAEESDVAGAVTISGLIDLVATGAIEIEEPMDAPLHLDGTTVTWRVLYYLGAVTYDLQIPSTFRIANSAILSLIHSRIDGILAARHELKDRLCRAVDWITGGDHNLFIQVLSDVLVDQTTRSMDGKHEPDLRGVFELVMGNTCCGETTQLIGPLELFSSPGVSHVRMRDPADKQVRRWDLRTLTLFGMWQGANPNEDKPSVDALQKLHKELVGDDEEGLLARPYSEWSPTLNAMETVLVRSFVEAEPEIPLFLAVGGARVLARRRS
ncbi:hypothetical protein C8R44DRAFT_727160 [Mycena epipterygia]|nr:hypothetical protein C8R44DRAFT_727160 [Mycena epipterygia]